MNPDQPTVLLVEDEPNDVLFIRRAFKKAGITCPIQVLPDGEQSVLYLSGQEPYADRERYPIPILAILDLKLPRKSGLELLEWLRQQPGLKRLPVVVLTSSAQATDINRAYDLGANSYLVKPVNRDDLLDLVKALDMYWLALNQRPEMTLP